MFLLIRNHIGKTRHKLSYNSFHMSLYHICYVIIPKGTFQVPTEPLTGTLHLVCASEDALTDLLDLDPVVADTEEFIDFVAGKYHPEGSLTVSHR